MARYPPIKYSSSPPRLYVWNKRKSTSRMLKKATLFVRGLSGSSGLICLSWVDFFNQKTRQTKQTK